MPFLKIDNREVNYQEWGSGGTPLLMLHGWPADSSHYNQVGPLLANKGIRVIVPDFPGWGESQPPTVAWSVTDYKEWVHKFVQTIKLKDFYLFGHSFGGRVSIKYAVEYPYEIKGLILCAAAGIMPDPTTLKRRALKMTATMGKKAFALPGISKLAPYARKALYKAAGSNDYLSVEGIMKETIVKVLEEDLTPLLNHIQIQTFILWGEEDGATPLHDGEIMNERIPKSGLTVLPGAKHNLPKNNPAEVADEVAKFINQNYAVIG